MDPAASQHTAIVWLDAAHAEPRELFSALESRGIRAVRVSSPFMAIAEVCREFRSRPRATPDKPAGMLAVVVVNPESRPQSCALCEVVARYAAGTTCWMYGPASGPKLRPINGGDLEGWRAPAPAAAPSPARAPAPRPAEPGRPPTVSPMSVRAARTESAGAHEPPSRPSGPPALRLTGTDGPKLSPRTPDQESVGAGEGTEAARSVLTPEELAMLLGDEESL